MAKRKLTTYRTNKEALVKLEQRNIIIDLRIKGHSYPVIAKESKISTSRAYQIVQEYIKEHREKHADKIDHMIEIDTQRIDKLMSQLWKKWEEEGEIAAAGMILKAMERRAKMLGLDSQEKSSVEIQMKWYEKFDPNADWPEQVKE